MSAFVGHRSVIALFVDWCSAFFPFGGSKPRMAETDGAPSRPARAALTERTDAEMVTKADAVVEPNLVALSVTPVAPSEAKASTPKANRLLAARLSSVSRLNPPTARAKSKTRVASPGSKPRPVKPETKAKRQPRTALGPAIRRGNRPAVARSSNVIDLAEAKRKRQPRQQRTAA